MNDQPPTDLSVWEQFGPFVELLMASLLVLVAVHLVAMVVMIVCLCRETTRGDRERTAIDQRLPVVAGEPKEPPCVESHCLTA